MASNKPKILWMIDGKGWGWDIRSNILSKLLPGYEHVRLFAESNLTEEGHARLLNSQNADIVVCPHPESLRFFENTKNVINILCSFRALEGWMR